MNLNYELKYLLLPYFLSPQWRISIAMACLRIILRDETQTVGGRSCPVGRVLSSSPEGPGSRLAWRKLPCTLMAPGACKISRGCNVFKFPSKLYLWGYQSRGRIKFAMACLRIILRDESQTVEIAH